MCSSFTCSYPLYTRQGLCTVTKIINLSHDTRGTKTWYLAPGLGVQAYFGKLTATPLCHEFLRIMLDSSILYHFQVCIEHQTPCRLQCTIQNTAQIQLLMPAGREVSRVCMDCILHQFGCEISLQSIPGCYDLHSIAYALGLYAVDTWVSS